MTPARNLLSLLRRMRRARRAILAVFVIATLQSTVLPCAMAFQSATLGGFSEHCVYCPHVSGHSERQDTAGRDGGCKFSHAATVSASNATQPVAAIGLGATADVSHVPDLALPRATKFPVRLLNRTLDPPRPIALTYCVQLK